jgi:hypothetical protein
VCGDKIYPQSVNDRGKALSKIRNVQRKLRTLRNHSATYTFGIDGNYEAKTENFSRVAFFSGYT